VIDDLSKASELKSRLEEISLFKRVHPPGLRARNPRNLYPLAGYGLFSLRNSAGRCTHFIPGRGESLRDTKRTRLAGVFQGNSSWVMPWIARGLTTGGWVPGVGLASHMRSWRPSEEEFGVRAGLRPGWFIDMATSPNRTQESPGHGAWIDELPRPGSRMIRGYPGHRLGRTAPGAGGVGATGVGDGTEIPEIACRNGRRRSAAELGTEVAGIWPVPSTRGRPCQAAFRGIAKR